MAIWFFGDSFSTPGPEHPPGSVDHATWMDILTKKLGLNGYNNYAIFGAPNIWIIKQFLDQYEDYKNGDHIVVQTTAYNRRWFFEDRPDHSNIFNVPIEPNEHLSKEESDAIKYYTKYLFNETADQLDFFCHLKTMRLFQLTNKHLNLCVLPGWGEVDDVAGNLIDICHNEFISDQVREEYYKKGERRLNHMHPENHELLADRIYDFFKHGTTLDLITGFKTNIING